MAKNTDYSFTHTDSGSAGDMVCATCRQPIENSKYLVYKKWNNGDWGYMTHHLSCALLNDKFAVMYANHVKKAAEAKAEKEKKIAVYKKNAIGIINSANYIEIEDGYEYDCFKIVMIYND